MKCELCKRKVSRMYGVPGVGMVCKKCSKKAVEKRKRLNRTLLKEDLGKMPERLDARDFDRWALKLAIKTIDGLSDAQREEAAKKAPLLLIPEEYALDIKERVLNAVIAEYRERYIVMERTKGYARWSAGGTYRFKGDIPKLVVLNAAKRADLITLD